MADADIRPCPFCGRSIAKLVSDPDRMGHYVECGNPCYARGPLHQGNVAIRLWNEGLPPMKPRLTADQHRDE